MEYGWDGAGVRTRDGGGSTQNFLQGKGGLKQWFDKLQSENIHVNDVSISFQRTPNLNNEEYITEIVA